ncbi:MAG: FUSC family protein [Sphingobium sp.]
MPIPGDSFQRLLSRIDARTVDEAECVVSVLLAIAVAHWLGADHVSWAAYAGYMVMRGHVAETLSRGILRIAGTAAGGVMALSLATPMIGHVATVACLLFVVGTFSLYAAIVFRRSYAWLFFGLTFVMVVLDKMEHPEIALSAFVQTRMLETVAGTAACMAVSMASAVTLRRRWPAIRTPAAPTYGWHGDAVRHSVQCGIALLLMALVGPWLNVPALAQGAVTIMAVMLVPVSGLGPHPVRRRIRQRLLGCLAGAGVAILVLLAARGSAPILILGTIIGVIVGRHIENGPSPYRYAGMQFTLAILVILVPDSYAGATTAPGLERLLGILLGMALLEPVLWAFRLVGTRGSSDSAGAAAAGKVGDI